MIAEERRAELRAAVAAALATGSLAELLRLARARPKAYRDMLAEVGTEREWGKARGGLARRGRGREWSRGCLGLHPAR